MNWMNKIHFLPFGVKNFESHYSRMCYSEIREKISPNIIKIHAEHPATLVISTSAERN